MDNNQKETKVIFETVYYEKEDDFLLTIQNLNDEQKNELIKRIFNYSYKQGIYSLSEAEFISVLIRYL
jgi:hypothetical protein